MSSKRASVFQKARRLPCGTRFFRHTPQRVYVCARVYAGYSGRNGRNYFRRDSVFRRLRFCGASDRRRKTRKAFFNRADGVTVHSYAPEQNENSCQYGRKTAYYHRIHPNSPNHVFLLYPPSPVISRKSGSFCFFLASGRAIYYNRE